jgi:hypothetical protein
MRGQGTDRAGRPQDAERDAAKPIAGQPGAGDDEPLEEPQRAPSLLSARELQARVPAKPQPQADDEPEGEDGDAPVEPTQKPQRKPR